MIAPCTRAVETIAFDANVLNVRGRRVTWGRRWFYFSLVPAGVRGLAHFVAAFSSKASSAVTGTSLRAPTFNVASCFRPINR
jgi:hypothetical protein